MQIDYLRNIVRSKTQNSSVVDAIPLSVIVFEIFQEIYTINFKSNSHHQQGKQSPIKRYLYKYISSKVIFSPKIVSIKFYLTRFSSKF